VLTPPHPDLASDLAVPDAPHLAASVFGSHAVIGPLVVPDVTSCLHCRDLHRRDADRDWPLLSVQWAQALGRMHPLPVDGLLLMRAAVEIVQLIRTWVDAPEDVEAWGEHSIHLDLLEPHPRRRSAPAHALCGCQWGVIDQD